MVDNWIDGEHHTGGRQNATPLIQQSITPSPHSEMAECRGLAPLARRHALVSTEARLAWPVDIPNWPAEPKLDGAKAGPRGRTCTCNLSVLSGTPLHWATRGGAPGQICTDTVRGLSPLPLRWATGAKW